MPRALAIETSGRHGSIAITDGNDVVAHEAFEHGLAHAAALLPTIDRLFKERAWTPDDLEHIYVSVGPGSFTGLRIGITVAKTLAMATGAKLVAVPSVEVLARNAPPEAAHLLIVLDAKRDQIFTARFERTDIGWQTREVAHLDRLADAVARAPKPTYLLGEGLPFHAKFLDVNDAAVVPLSSEFWRAKAEELAVIGQTMAADNQFTEPDQLLPTYVRRPEAEEKREAALCK